MDEGILDDGLLLQGVEGLGNSPLVGTGGGIWESMQAEKEEVCRDLCVSCGNVETSTGEVTRLLQDWSVGNREALDRLLPLVYAELRRLAHSYLKHERPDHTLQTTALVHEAYLKLVDQHSVNWQDRAHFFAIAAQAMRRILLDNARRRTAAKRGNGEPKLSLDEAVTVSGETANESLIALDTALQELEKIDVEQSRVVELRYFGGLTIAETAEVMKTSPATVKREWTMARAWLYKTITGARESPVEPNECVSARTEVGAGFVCGPFPTTVPVYALSYERTELATSKRAIQHRVGTAAA